MNYNFILYMGIHRDTLRRYINSTHNAEVGGSSPPVATISGSPCCNFKLVKSFNAALKPFRQKLFKAEAHGVYLKIFILKVSYKRPPGIMNRGKSIC